MGAAVGHGGDWADKAASARGEGEGCRAGATLLARALKCREDDDRQQFHRLTCPSLGEYPGLSIKLAAQDGRD